ncbi:LexA family protein [Pseudoxanthomonas winnipegensis]|uniref:LexA family protein n=1 Tax=Pseudoxanthomonas winnipegensis TaxID=2480810 RepID=UPI00103FF67E|nr:translesion error-prone DNA polymerase V autoproteolytic subunit [Pseudoxanthomonas winnipegensis]TBV69777.1 translesion error-prone DNA polymerase V autoproteolytic subunit [Pseudoxanthomonas winnipegensis]
MSSIIAIQPYEAPPAALLRPVLGVRATAGFPSPAEDFQTEALDLNALCIRNAPATFFAQVDQSTSMVDYGIFPGDTLVVDRSITPRHGHIVIALWEGGLTVKKLRVSGRRITLMSGGDHPHITVPPDVELEIWGVVTWNFRKLL